MNLTDFVSAELLERWLDPEVWAADVAAQDAIHHRNLFELLLADLWFYRLHGRTDYALRRLEEYLSPLRSPEDTLAEHQNL